MNGQRRNHCCAHGESPGAPEIRLSAELRGSGVARPAGGATPPAPVDDAGVGTGGPLA